MQTMLISSRQSEDLASPTPGSETAVSQEDLENVSPGTSMWVSDAFLATKIKWLTSTQAMLHQRTS
jgi:hypothetical protein